MAIRSGWLAALVVFVLGASAVFGIGCAPSRSSPKPVDWITQPPDGCAVGASGSTLYPGDAMRQAQRDAIQGLVGSDVDAVIRSQVLDTSDGRYAWTHQETSGRVVRSRIVAMWAQLRSGDPITRRRDVFALACSADHDPAGLPQPAYPDWVLNPPRDARRICAPAIAGPTYFAVDQEPAAIRDGQRALAEALESLVHEIIIDDERSLPAIHGTLEPTPEAWEKAERATELEARWMDESGVGPMQIRRTLYGLLCVPL